MKTKLFSALLCAMCIGFMGCKGNDPEFVGIRQASGYTIYEVTIDGTPMWFSRPSDAIDTTNVYLTSSYSFYQQLDDTKDYKGDFVVPSSFNALGVTFHVIGLQKHLGSGFINTYVCPFKGCSQLTSVTLPDGFTYVGGYAFPDLDELHTINFSNSIDSIGTYAIDGCPQLKTLNLSSNLRVMSSRAISNCGIETLTLPASLIDMNHWGAIYNCKSLKEIYVLAVTPPVASNHIQNCDSLANIYVPSSSVSAYKQAEGWSDFANIISAMP